MILANSSGFGIHFDVNEFIEVFFMLIYYSIIQQYKNHYTPKFECTNYACTHGDKCSISIDGKTREYETNFLHCVISSFQLPVTAFPGNTRTNKFIHHG